MADTTQLTKNRNHPPFSNAGPTDTRCQSCSIAGKQQPDNRNKKPELITAKKRTNKKKRYLTRGLEKSCYVTNYIAGITPKKEKLVRIMDETTREEKKS